MGYQAADVAPWMWGFQAAGAAPLVSGEIVEEPETFATAIRIGNPASWRGAVGARDESGGRIEAVTDEEILAAYRLLATTEGVFCEPASAASVAGILKFHRALPEGPVVCTLTGHGLKDPDTAVDLTPPLEPVAPVMDAVLERLDW
jgi:threonine synthase